MSPPQRRNPPNDEWVPLGKQVREGEGVFHFERCQFFYCAARDFTSLCLSSSILVVRHTIQIQNIPNSIANAHFNNKSATTPIDHRRSYQGMYGRGCEGLLEASREAEDTPIPWRARPTSWLGALGAGSSFHYQSP